LFSAATLIPTPAALLAAGFAVVRMPERLHEHMAIPGDEFLEATKVGDLDAVWKEIEAIIEPFNGDCQSCGEPLRKQLKAS
jgi:hypothetical protein